MPVELVKTWGCEFPQGSRIGPLGTGSPMVQFDKCVNDYLNPWNWKYFIREQL